MLYERKVTNTGGGGEYNEYLYCIYITCEITSCEAMVLHSTYNISPHTIL